MSTPSTLDPDAGVRTLVHPGPVAASRVISVPTRLTAHDVELPADTPLLEALRWLLDRTGTRAACGELLGGELAEFSYFVPDVGSDGGPVATFSAPRAGRAPGRLHRGGLTIGTKDGAVFAHSHALVTDAGGAELAGHLIPDSVVLGSGVRARVWAGADIAIEVQPDPETLMSLFVPRSRADGGPRPAGGGDVAALVCRVRPNVDLVRVILALTDQQGWAGADVRGQIGSLVGGRLARPDGSVLDVDGPATEVMFLDGRVHTLDGRLAVDLDAHLVDRHARVHSGRLVPGRNPVAMTYELVLTRADPPTV